jgi:phosphoglycolate phosphatase
MARSAGAALAVGIAGSDAAGIDILPDANYVISSYSEIEIGEGER